MRQKCLSQQVYFMQEKPSSENFRNTVGCMMIFSRNRLRQICCSDPRVHEVRCCPAFSFSFLQEKLRYAAVSFSLFLQEVSRYATIFFL
jgi:hypothetical protein